MHQHPSQAGTTREVASPAITRTGRHSTAPVRPALDDARRKHLADHLIAYAVIEAERAVLELDALMIDPRRRRGVRRDLAGRLMAMVDEWFEAATQKGQGECPGVAAAAKAAERSFRARVRELRAAAAPGGHA